MATVILNHKVKDFASWKVGYDADSPRRQGGGLKEIAVGEKQGEPGMAYMIWDVQDTSVISKMMADPGLQEAMEKGGVISKPEMIIIE